MQKLFTQDKLDRILLMIDEEFQHHSKLRLVDIYKLYMQTVYGPGHIIRDKDSAKEYLSIELAERKNYISIFPKDTKNKFVQGLKEEFVSITNQNIICPSVIIKADAVNPYIRLSLTVIKDNLISLEEYFEAFILSTEINPNISDDQFIANWLVLVNLIENKYDIPNIKADANVIRYNLVKRNFLFSHSEEYHKHYLPAYRIINIHLLEKHIDKINDFYFNK